MSDESTRAGLGLPSGREQRRGGVNPRPGLQSSPQGAPRGPEAPPPRAGVTGTRTGASQAQLVVARRWLTATGAQAPERWLHHGDCEGADEQVADLARELGWRLHCHPPEDQRARAFVDSDIYAEPAPYLARNRAIVDACDALLALPRLQREEVRSGTWQTVRYAWEVGRVVVLVWPSGATEIHRSRPQNHWRLLEVGDDA